MTCSCGGIAIPVNLRVCSLEAIHCGFPREESSGEGMMRTYISPSQRAENSVGQAAYINLPLLAVYEDRGNRNHHIAHQSPKEQVIRRGAIPWIIFEISNTSYIAPEFKEYSDLKMSI